MPLKLFQRRLLGRTARRYSRRKKKSEGIQPAVQRPKRIEPETFDDQDAPEQVEIILSSFLFPSFLNIRCPEATAKVFFKLITFCLSAGGLLALLHNTRENLVYITPRNHLCLFSPDYYFLVIMSVYQASYMRNKVFSRSPPAPQGAVGSTSTGGKRGYQARGEAALCW